MSDLNWLTLRPLTFSFSIITIRTTMVRVFVGCSAPLSSTRMELLWGQSKSVWTWRAVIFSAYLLNICWINRRWLKMPSGIWDRVMEGEHNFLLLSCSSGTSRLQEMTPDSPNSICQLIPFKPSSFFQKASGRAAKVEDLSSNPQNPQGAICNSTHPQVQFYYKMRGRDRRSPRSLSGSWLRTHSSELKTLSQIRCKVQTAPEVVLWPSHGSCGKHIHAVTHICTQHERMPKWERNFTRG